MSVGEDCIVWSWRVCVSYLLGDCHALTSRTDRVGTRDLLDFFRHLTKPAVVQLLLETLNDAAFAEALPFTNLGFERTTPVGYLQAELVGEKLRYVVSTGCGR